MDYEMTVAIIRKILKFLGLSMIFLVALAMAPETLGLSLLAYFAALNLVAGE